MDAEKRIEELEQQVEELQDRLPDGVNRREFGKAAGALGLGALLGGGGAATAIDSASADASTSDQYGDVGEPGDRVDVFADGVNTNSLDADELSSNSISTDEVNNIIQVPQFGSLQDAFDTVEQNDEIWITDDITLTNPAILETDDVTLRQKGGRITVDVGTGNDGIIVQPGADSVRKGIRFELGPMGVTSGRHGVFYDTCVRNCIITGATGGHSGDAGGYLVAANRSWGISVRDVQPQGGTGGGGVYVEGGHKGHISNVLAKGLSGDGIRIEKCAAASVISCDGESNGGHGIVVDQSPGAAVYSPYTESNSGDGLLLDGDTSTPNRPFEVTTYAGRHIDNGGYGVNAKGVRDSFIGRFHYSGNTSGALNLGQSAVRVDAEIRDRADATIGNAGHNLRGYNQATERYTFDHDTAVEQPGDGLVVTTPDGSAKYRIRVDNSGTLVTDAL